MGEARVILFAKCKLADSFRTLLRWLGTRSTLVPFGLRCTASAIFRKEREKPEMWKVVHVSTYLALHFSAKDPCYATFYRPPFLFSFLVLLAWICFSSFEQLPLAESSPK